MNRSPFSPRTVLGMVLIGALAFVALLWFLGTEGGNANNGGGHVGGRGLNGYAGLAALLEADGLEVGRARSKNALEQVGLLILTPPADAKGADIAKVVDARRTIGPTLVVTPKWMAANARAGMRSKTPAGWVRIVGTAPPSWAGFHDEITVDMGKDDGPRAGGWRTADRHGRLPDDRRILSGSGKTLVPLVKSGDGRVLAAFVADDGYYPALNGMAGINNSFGGEDSDLYPVVFVFEPDLLDNWGLADRHTAMMARELVLDAAGGRSQPVMFDLTLNGLGASRNLLTLAFEPPFLAATICMLLAALAVGWRAFNRFGPAQVGARAIALGKSALVANSAGLIRRTGRVHLVAAPYADAARERLVVALGLPRGRSTADSEIAIDRVRAGRGLTGPGFAESAARLRAARKGHDVVRRAAALQQIEKELM
jgi:hypothetical protein